jgi:uncharacterized protein (TIGR04551 family)
LFGAAAAALVVGVSADARATGLSDHGQDLHAAPESVLEAHGYFRTRGAVFHNLDLDRGPTPSGQTLYPLPLDNPTGQALTLADMRIRSDLAAYWPNGGLAVKVRLDGLDNVALGSAPEGAPSVSLSQRPEGALLVRRAYGEALTPLGLLAVGRMGSHWGLGMLTNGGDCESCDSGDAADRIAFITPLGGHLWALAYDFSATGPFVPARSEQHVVDVAPSANVHTITFATMRYRSAQTVQRRLRADKWTLEYGSFFTYRWQNDDVPGSYLPTAQPIPLADQSLMARDFESAGADLYMRLSGKALRIAFEAAYLHANLAQASVIPGVLLRDPVTSNQIGVALESEIGDPAGCFNGGLDAGVASGDRAPGFGSFPTLGAQAPRAGDLDGPQASPGVDNTVDNFRFHPDYRVDRILFREIVGTVTDAIYLRPHLSYKLWRSHRGTLSAKLAGIASFAFFAESAPGEQQPLGVELDPTLRYDSADGFSAALEQATLIPLSGLDNPRLGLDARVAQLWRLRLMYRY